MDAAVIDIQGLNTSFGRNQILKKITSRFGPVK